MDSGLLECCVIRCHVKHTYMGLSALVSLSALSLDCFCETVWSRGKVKRECVACWLCMGLMSSPGLWLLDLRCAGLQAQLIVLGGAFTVNGNVNPAGAAGYISQHIALHLVHIKHSDSAGHALGRELQIVCTPCLQQCMSAKNAAGKACLLSTPQPCLQQPWQMQGQLSRCCASVLDIALARTDLPVAVCS